MNRGELLDWCQKQCQCGILRRREKLDSCRVNQTMRTDITL